jgi:hypothetical protein
MSPRRWTGLGSRWRAARPTAPRARAGVAGDSRDGFINELVARSEEVAFRLDDYQLIQAPPVDVSLTLLSVTPLFVAAD